MDSNFSDFLGELERFSASDYNPYAGFELLSYLEKNPQTPSNRVMPLYRMMKGLFDCPVEVSYSELIADLAKVACGYVSETSFVRMQMAGEFAFGNEKVERVCCIIRSLEEPYMADVKRSRDYASQFDVMAEIALEAGYAEFERDLTQASGISSAMEMRH